MRREGTIRNKQDSNLRNMEQYTDEYKDLQARYRLLKAESVKTTP